MSRVVDAISPARLGPSYRRLLLSSWITNLGDGIGLAAGPLLVASQTRDPLLVAAASMLQRLPWLVFGLYAGVIADRHDRRLIVASANIARGAVLAVVVGMVALDAMNVAVVLVAMFLLGTAEVFVDTTANTLLPMIVASDDLGVANSRIMAGQIVVNQLVGPPIGGFLFVVGIAWPLVGQVVLFVAGALVLVRIPFPVPERRTGEQHARREIADGLRWLWSHGPVRTLTLTVVSFNITFGATMAVMVLYVEEQLGLGEIGFGVLTTMTALGGLVGSWGYGWLQRHLSLANIMRAGLIIEIGTHLTLALTSMAVVAASMLFVFGVHEAAWGTTAVTIRQRAVPAELQGRVSSVYMLGVFGGLVGGSAIGGLIARVWSVTDVFWFAFVGSVVILALIWRSLDEVALVGPAGSGPLEMRR